MGEKELALKRAPASTPRGAPAKQNSRSTFVHPSAQVSEGARIGAGTYVWAFAQVREGVRIGRDCVIGNGAYLDSGVRIGDGVNIHNKALLYRNMTVGNRAFIGPGVCFVNDPAPRANRIRDLSGKTRAVGEGASVGANATILSDICVGRFAMVGAGSIVSSDVPDYGLVYGVPARLRGFVSPAGKRLVLKSLKNDSALLAEPVSAFELRVPRAVYDQLQKD